MKGKAQKGLILYGFAMDRNGEIALWRSGS
jgi:hypothetical protein